MKLSLFSRYNIRWSALHRRLKLYSRAESSENRNSLYHSRLLPISYHEIVRKGSAGKPVLQPEHLCVLLILAGFDFTTNLTNSLTSFSAERSWDQVRHEEAVVRQNRCGRIFCFPNLPIFAESGT